jgi:hypothetical protein
MYSPFDADMTFSSVTAPNKSIPLLSTGDMFNFFAFEEQAARIKRSGIRHTPRIGSKAECIGTVPIHPALSNLPMNVAHPILQTNTPAPEPVGSKQCLEKPSCLTAELAAADLQKVRK